VREQAAHKRCKFWQLPIDVGSAVVLVLLTSLHAT
jgi:hypothetical protein